MTLTHFFGKFQVSFSGGIPFRFRYHLDLDKTVPVQKLADRILCDGERIASLKAVKFRRPIGANLLLSVTREGSLPRKVNGLDLALEGIFLIRGGRELRFYGHELPYPITVSGVKNPALDFFRMEGVGEPRADFLEVKIDFPSCSCGPNAPNCAIGEIRQLICRKDLLLSTIMDIVIDVLLRFGQANLYSERILSASVVSFDNVVLPADPEDFFNGGGQGHIFLTVRLLPDKARTMISGVKAFPVEFVFSRDRISGALPSESVSRVVIGLAGGDS